MPNEEAEFTVEQIDHVELSVPDRYEAAKWYEEILGMKIDKKLEKEIASMGPLMIITKNASTMLALFEGQSEKQSISAGFERVAFSVSAKNFQRFVNRLETHPVYDESGNQLSKNAVTNHEIAYSLYFCDPYGHKLEITTYDYDEYSKMI